MSETRNTYGVTPVAELNADLPDFDEASASQIPALLVLVNLGYTYISRKEISEMREEDNSRYVLRDITFDALRKINDVNTNISDKSIRDAIFEAEQIDMGVGAIPASEEVYSLMLAGRSVSELIDGRRVSTGSIRYISATRLLVTLSPNICYAGVNSRMLFWHWSQVRTRRRASLLR